MGSARAEERLVKISQRARYRMCGKIFTQPFPLRRRSVAPANINALAVQHHHVPASEFVAVVASCSITRRRSKILEIVRRSFGVEFMVARRRTSTIFHAPPSLVVTRK